MIGGGGGGANTDRVAEGHCEGEGAGGRCALSCTEHEAETTSSEWEAKKRSIANNNNLHL